MANLDEALQQLREERAQAQFRVEKLYQAISTIESLNGSGASRKTTRPTRIMSAAARRRMARAQRARWARARANNVVPISAKRGKHTISAAGRKRIAAAARARWAKFRAAKKNA
jgi:phage major head subunit gpT-like protein